MKLLRLSVSFLILVCLHGCTPEPGPFNTTTSVDVQDVNTNLASTVILQQVFEIDVKIASLNYYVSKFIADRNQTTLDSARIAWKSAHEWWAESQAMLLGPARDGMLTEAMDSFPIVVADVKQILAQTPIITQEMVVGMRGSLKGFHVLEYLLFGLDGNKQVAEFTSKELNYIGAITFELERLSQSLRYSWDPARENYVAQITTPGQQGGAYETDKDALRDILDGMIYLCDDLSERKIGKPLDLHADSLEESRFSSNSTNDYRSNLRSILYIYQGGREPGFLGISALVYTKSGQELVDKVFADITNAQVAIDLLVPTFSSSLTTDPERVASAREAVRTLKNTLTNDVKPLVLQ